MSIRLFILLIKRHLILLATIPVLLAIIVFTLSHGTEQKYKSNTKIYTGIASGYTIESGSNNRIDYFAVNNAFDNLLEVINGRETKEEVGIRLLAQHIFLDSINEMIISQPHLEELKALFTNKEFENLRKKTYHETVNNLHSLLKSREQNPIKELLNNPIVIYSPEGLSAISFSRIASSDMIEGYIEYIDPGVCQQALNIYIEVFSSKYKEIKQNETSSVVSYFKKQSEQVYDKLTSEENSLRKFREQHKIINYYEQTKYISAKSEDLEEDLHNEKLNIAAASAAVERTEEYLGNRKTILKYSDEIIDLRNRLTKSSRELAFEQTNTNPDAEKINELEREITIQKEKMTSAIQDLYDTQHSTEGIPLNELLNEWLMNTLIVDQGTARVEVLEQRKREFLKKYEKFAPLGSSLKRYDRKIDVIEREYLQLLHSLNSSKMKQQNIELSNTLKVIDNPNFPIIPEPSKKLRKTMLGFIVGAVVTLSILVLLEVLDNTLKTIKNGEDKIGLKLVSAFPNIHHLDRDTNFNIVSNLVIKELIQQIKIHTADNHHPKTISIFSTKPKEGKSLIVEILKKNLEKRGKKVLRLSPMNKNKIEGISYKITNDFSEKKTFNEIISEKIDLSTFDIILFEIPAILTEEIPSELIKNTDFNLLITRSNRTWSSSDQNALNTYRKTAINQPYLFLNGISVEEIEPLIGEIPKSRSKLRRFMKNLIRFNMYSKSNF